MEDFMLEGSQSTVTVLQDLNDPKDIEMKTDLTIDQIKVLCEIKWFEIITDPMNWDKSCAECLGMWKQYYMTLLTSLGRKSRDESVRGVSQMSDKAFQEYLINMNGSKQK